MIQSMNEDMDSKLPVLGNERQRNLCRPMRCEDRNANLAFDF